MSSARALFLSCATISALLACTPASTPTDAAIGVDSPAPLDAGAADVGADAGGCADLTGAYAFTGSCSTAGFSPIALVCVDSQALTCGAEVEYASFPPEAVMGTIAGSSLSFVGCTMNVGGSSATLHCAMSGGGTCNGSGSRVSFPGATHYCCQPGPTASGCAASERCTIVSDDASNTNPLTACVPTGSLTEGTACTRTGGRVGADDCGAGLFCANTRQPTATMRICQRLCEREADCMTGETCIWLGSTPPAGVCTGRCTIGGTDCPTGNTCRSVGTLGVGSPAVRMAYGTYCQQAGAAVLGGACTAPTDCGPNLTCPLAGDSATLANTCRPTCDTAHPCAGAAACIAFTGAPNPSGLGFCGT